MVNDQGDGHFDFVGPDASDGHDGKGLEENVGDPVEVFYRQICNRWVFLKHQRPAALSDIRQLVMMVKRQVRDA